VTAIETGAIVSRLMDKEGYSKREALRAAEDLACLPPAVHEAFIQWWTTGEETPPIEIAGFTTSRLIDEWQMTPVAAFLTLGWLAEDPESALAAMREGVDRIR
jgi:hypothetical protein